MRFQNFRKKILATAAISTLSAFSLPLSAQAAPSDILFILDGSGSMWGQIDAKAKIETAKNTMASLLDSTPADARIGLMTYGTTSKKSCTDGIVLNPVGADRAAIKQSVAGLTPLGKTPIDLALAMGVKPWPTRSRSTLKKSRSSRDECRRFRRRASQSGYLNQIAMSGVKLTTISVTNMVRMYHLQ